MDHSSASLRLDPNAGGKLLDNAIAKRKDEGQEEQSYRTHVTAVYEAWCGLIVEHRALIDRIARRHGLTTERLLQSSLLCVALHDVGKLTANFQRMMRAVGDKAYRDAQNRNYRHEIASLWFVEVTAQSLAKSYGSIPGGGYLEVLAVAGHHKFLADDYLFNEGKFQNPIDWEPDTFSAVKAAYGLAKEMFQVRGWALRLKVDPCELERMLSNRDGTSNHPFDRMKEAKNALARAPGPEKASYRDLFILLKGLLMTADWMASGQQGPRVEMEASRHFLHIDPAKLLDHVKTKVETDRRDAVTRRHSRAIVRSRDSAAKRKVTCWRSRRPAVARPRPLASGLCARLNGACSETLLPLADNGHC